MIEKEALNCLELAVYDFTISGTNLLFLECGFFLEAIGLLYSVECRPSVVQDSLVTCYTYT